MAKQPSLEIDGTRYPRIYEVSFSLFTDKDETGKPADRARVGLIKVTREVTSNQDIFRWATDSSKKNFKSGKLMFRDPESEEDLVALEFENGFVSYYEYHCPHVKHNGGDQMFEYFEISAERVTLGSDSINQSWETDETL
jgi:hypothetical protein